MNSKPPCKFFAAGNCRKGNSCPFPHIRSNSGNSNSAGFGSRQSTFGQVDLNKRLKDFWDPSSLDRKASEITEEIKDVNGFQCIATSSFGLAYPAVENLITGRDYSFEESRFDYYMAQQNNTIPDYEKIMNIRTQDMKNCIDFLKADPRKAARYTQITAKEKFENPSSIIKPLNSTPLDLTGNGMNSSTQSPFGASGFGNTANNGPTNPFGTSNPFGSSTSSGVFGNQNTKPSIFGSSSLSTPSKGSAFGQSSMGQNGSNAFGAQSLGSTNNNSGSAFGQSAFGTQLTTSPFGAKPLGSTTSPAAGAGAFGSSGFGGAKPSPFGSSGFGGASFSSTSNTGGAFGSSGFGQKPSTTSTFGQQQPAAQTSAFGTSGFGSTQSSSPFGAAAAGSPNNTASPFATAATSSSNNAASPFGSVASGTTSAFGQPNTASPLGQAATSSFSSPFGSTPTASGGTVASPFTQASAGTTTAQAQSQSLFGSTNSAFGQPQSTAGGFGSGAFGGLGNSLNTANGSEFKPAFAQSAKEEPRANANDLDEQVKAQFEADDFQIGLVPEIQPPLVYC